MIKIIYEADPEGGKLTMRAEGHAGYAPAGQDIVCAAVSCLMQTLAYSAAEDEHTSSCIYQGKDGPVVSVEAGDSVSCGTSLSLWPTVWTCWPDSTRRM